jgi:hypothetical protein
MAARTIRETLTFNEDETAISVTTKTNDLTVELDINDGVEVVHLSADDARDLAALLVTAADRAAPLTAKAVR